MKGTMLTLSQTLLSSVIILSVWQVNCSAALEFSSYARVSRNGDSISIQSDRGNKSIDQITTKVSDIDSTLIDNLNKTTGGREAKQMSDESSSEKSTGRAVQSNYFSPLTQLMTRPVQRSSYNNDKTGRLIVYPSYSASSSNSIDPSRIRYNNNMMPPTGQQPAQRRFQYTPDALYKFKGSGSSSQGYQYAQPPPKDSGSAPPPPMKFSAPIVVPDAPAAPPKPLYLPPDMLQPSPPKSSYLPSDMMPSAPGRHFLPTIPPKQTTSNNPVIDLLAFPSHVNSSYLPPELDAIKSSIENNHQPDIGTSDDETTYTPEENLHNFPPNIESAYLPPSMYRVKQLANSYLPVASGDESETSVDETTSYMPPENLNNFPPNAESVYLPPNMISSYLKPPSGDDEPPVDDDAPSAPYAPPKDLHSFPPNVHSAYLPPSMMRNKNPISSYLPPPSGNNEPPADDDAPSAPYAPPNDLHSFPPNVNSAYLPPSMMRNKNPINSYLPPPSGDISEVPNNAQPTEDETPYVPPKDLHNFPPNIDSAYLPPEMQIPDIPNNSYLPQPSGNEADLPAPSYMYIPPNNLHRFPPNVESSYLPPGMNQIVPTVNSYLPPASGSVSGFYDGSKQNFPGPMNQMQTAPSGPPMDMQPPADAPMDDHDHHHHHDHDHSAPDYSQWYGGGRDHDHHSEIIYDYDPHEHHHHHVEPETTTTEAPEEPRVKKYSYYYLGRKLWYIPLYFTLWFCLYVAALIIRSIGRHKVDLPNHYVSRSLHDMTHEETVEKINRMTVFVMNQIEDFKEKYL